MTENQRTTKADTARMLRTLAAGDHVIGTRSSTREGQTGTVLDPEPFVTDGVRRVRVLWHDDGATVLVLPSSIRPAGEG